MSVAPQSIVPPRRRRSRREAVSLRSNQGKVNISSQQSNVPSKMPERKLERLPDSRLKPVWLRSLLAMQRSSVAIVFLLAGATLTVYAWTVYTQKLWSTEYRKLATLQRHERHFTATNEIIKNQLAQESERPDNGLVSPKPAHTIFLPAMPQRQSAVKPVAPTEPELAPTKPLGY